MTTDIFDSQSPLVIQPLMLPVFAEKQLKVFMIRTDLAHSQISGNKWYKLKYNLRAARHQGATRIISFGGAYSNHIHALAYSAKAFGIDSIGVIRGEKVDNPTLADARKWGMQLHFVDRASYRQRHSVSWLAALQREIGPGFIIPEGGSNTWAVQGVSELMPDICEQVPSLDYLLCACGTGGTLAGLVSAAPEQVRVEGYPVLKGGEFLNADIQALLDSAGAAVRCSWSLDKEAHYGGYAKMNAEHRAKWLMLEEECKMLLDPVYTSKLLRRFVEKVQQNAYPSGSTLALVHTGGLQGRRSLV